MGRASNGRNSKKILFRFQQNEFIKLQFKLRQAEGAGLTEANFKNLNQPNYCSHSASNAANAGKKIIGIDGKKNLSFI
jgi:hypothetical protein